MDDDVRQQLSSLRLTSQADVHRLWQLVMQPLGFGSSSLWFTFVDDRDAPFPFLGEIPDDIEPGVPSPKHVARLYEALDHVAAEESDLRAVAFLITRPGRGDITESDRRLARLLLDGARQSRLRCLPVHVAHDTAILPVTPDDLAA